MLDIVPLPILDDNYVWLIRDDRQVVAVDPGQAAPVAEYLVEHGCNLSAILLTHRHHDHVGGVAELVSLYGCPVYGPPSLALVDRPVAEGDHLRLSAPALELTVWQLPGHTREHLGYLADGHAFVGDTLFACGCGRVFDGDLASLFHSLQRLAGLPPETKLYCTHEYTLANQRFACAVEPDNPSLPARMAQDQHKRAQGQPTLPTTIGAELDCNPFLRCDQPSIRQQLQQRGLSCPDAESTFIGLRLWKNEFR